MLYGATEKGTGHKSSKLWRNDIKNIARIFSSVSLLEKFKILPEFNPKSATNQFDQHYSSTGLTSMVKISKEVNNKDPNLKLELS